MVSQILKTKGVTSIFNSSQIPGEILDLLVVRTEVLKRPKGQKFAKAITGAWYEVTEPDEVQDKVLTGDRGGLAGHAASYKEQLSTTKLFYTPQSALQFMHARAI